MEIWIFLIGVAFGMCITCIIIVLAFVKELLSILEEKS